jgi:hypothetical protein
MMMMMMMMMMMTKTIKIVAPTSKCGDKHSLLGVRFKQKQLEVFGRKFLSNKASMMLFTLRKFLCCLFFYTLNKIA